MRLLPALDRTGRRRDDRGMTEYLWPGDPGWPSPEVDADEIDVSDPNGEIDFDAVCLHAAEPHVFDDLSPLERTVLAARFGLGGTPVRTMKELHAALGLTRHQVRDQLESALAKVRSRIA